MKLLNRTDITSPATSVTIGGFKPGHLYRIRGENVTNSEAIFIQFLSGGTPVTGNQEANRVFTSNSSTSMQLRGGTSSDTGDYFVGDLFVDTNGKALFVGEWAAQTRSASAGRVGFSFNMHIRSSFDSIKFIGEAGGSFTDGVIRVTESKPLAINRVELGAPVSEVIFDFEIGKMYMPFCYDVTGVSGAGVRFWRYPYAAEPTKRGWFDNTSQSAMSNGNFLPSIHTTNPSMSLGVLSSVTPPSLVNPNEEIFRVISRGITSDGAGVYSTIRANSGPSTGTASDWTTITQCAFSASSGNFSAGTFGLITLT